MQQLSVGLIVLLLLIGLAPAQRVSGEGSPPSVAEFWWEPRYPIHPQTVDLFAVVSDPDDDLVSVMATWCSLDTGICTFPSMSDAEGDGTWNGTAGTLFDASGAYMRIYAEDALHNYVETSKVYALFVHSLDLSLSPAAMTATPGGVVRVAGTAFYNGNASAPAEGLPLAISFNSAIYRAEVESSGDFGLDLFAPLTEGTFPIDAYATDRSLTDVAHGSVAVASIPTADLRIETMDPSSPSLIAGQRASVSFDIVNVGSAAANGVRVVATLQGSDRLTLFDETMDVPAGGGRERRAVEWIAHAGAQTLLIRVDPQDAVHELDESNNVVEMALLAGNADAPGSFPVLLAGAGIGAGVALVAGVAVLITRRRKAA